MGIFGKKRIFLDFAGGRDNPSALHEEGLEAKHRLEEARKDAASILHVQSRDIIFTSGGTESDNLALLGVFEAAREKMDKPHIIISSMEHSAIQESAKEILKRGGEVSVVQAEDGEIKAEKILSEIKENTVLVSIMYVNNETGGLQPIARIGKGIKELKKKNNSKIFFHSDASQAAHILSLDVSTLGVDLLTLDGSKVGGPKGVGLLVVRPGVLIKPIMFGGGQEMGLRPGTENVDSILKFVKNLKSAQNSREETLDHLKKVRDVFMEEIKSIPNIVINTPEVNVPTIVNVSFPGSLHEFLAVQLDTLGVSVSTGSSCKSNLREEGGEALRFSFGIVTSENEVREAARILRNIVVS
ncbi:cysteine desulfurase [Candidatus Parcubacteria bacterium]|nr:cysteine desulfurase [Candidatus Parcubacteria bacterium]